MASVRGYVDHIIFRNDDNGYRILELKNEEETYTLVGTLPGVNEGDSLEAQGSFVTHPVYGEQMRVETYSITEPDDVTSILRYLSSGAIKGIGAALAKRIVGKFGEDTLRIMDEEPERLAEVKGISINGARDIAAQAADKREMRQAMMYLQKYGITQNLAVKIYETYGSEIYTLIETNPYRIADDIPSVGFRTADEIAQKAGISADSNFRIGSGIYYTLMRAAGEGNVYLPRDILLHRTAQMLGLTVEEMQEAAPDLLSDPRLVVKRSPKSGTAEQTGTMTEAAARGTASVSGRTGDEPKDAAPTALPAGRKDDSDDPFAGIADEWGMDPVSGAANEGESAADDIVYPAVFYYMEEKCARMLLELAVDLPVDEPRMEQEISRIEKEEKISLDVLQRQAIATAIRSGVTVITGGPGTGKTTIIRTILRYFENHDADILLAAPTGRAAKRMSEATGREARTIHRLLEFNGKVEENQTGQEEMRKFERNESNPLEADVVIIDEMSMVDINLMYALLRALIPGTRLILVGDANQLPSVGPGNVLKDIMKSGCFPVASLTRIFRQSEVSDIVVNAHRIHNGEPIDPNKRSRDFLFVKRYDADHIIGAVMTLIRDKLPGYVHADVRDIQVLTPMRKGMLGVENLNRVLQGFLNPASPSKREKLFAGGVFREGDKVMQIRNDYQLEWEIRGKHRIVQEQGTGVFNGDIGVIRSMNLFTEDFEVEYDDGRIVLYSFKQADELELAYAVTVHKSQGSEYPAVIIPLLSGPPMLMNRNLIYTAVTRAKSCVCIVGPPESFLSMAQNTREERRYSGLDERLREAVGSAEEEFRFS